MVKTDIADIEVHAKPGLLKDVRFVVYADTDMNSKWKISEETITPTTISINGKIKVMESISTNPPATIRINNSRTRIFWCLEKILKNFFGL